MASTTSLRPEISYEGRSGLSDYRTISELSLACCYLVSALGRGPRSPSPAAVPLVRCLEPLVPPLLWTRLAFYRL